jgi:protoheme ferro-lyase
LPARLSLFPALHRGCHGEHDGSRRGEDSFFTPFTFLRECHHGQLHKHGAGISCKKLFADTDNLFSAHSLPTKYAGEPYQQQIEATVATVVAQAGITNHALGWQSIPNNASEPWITPTVEEQIDAIAKDGFTSIIQIPIGFTADHIETLYDIDITHRQYALARGLSFRRLSSLNAGDKFVQALQEIVHRFVNLP